MDQFLPCSAWLSSSHPDQEWLDVLGIKFFQMLRLNKNTPGYGCPPESNFNTGNVRHILVLLHFQRTLNIIVVGNGNTDPQSAGPRSNHEHGIVAIV